LYLHAYPTEGSSLYLPELVDKADAAVRDRSSAVARQRSAIPDR
jgi:hypothetical protein